MKHSTEDWNSMQWMHGYWRLLIGLNIGILWRYYGKWETWELYEDTESIGLVAFIIKNSVVSKAF